MQNIGAKFNTFGEWMYRLMILNALWIIGAILGLVVLGIFPATAALYAVLRQYFMKKKTVKPFKDFTSYYHKDFWKSNALGFTCSGIAVVLWFDFNYFMSITNFMTFVIAHFILIVFVLSLGSICVLFPIYVQYELSYKEYIKQVLFFPVKNLGIMFLLAVSMILCSFVFYQIPGLLPFLGISLPSFLVMSVLFPSFSREKNAKKGWFSRQKKETIYY